MSSPRSVPARPSAPAVCGLAALIAMAGAAPAGAAPMTVSSQTLLTPPGGELLTGYAPRTSSIEVGAPSTSLNGQIVAFASNARDLGSTGSQGTTQIYVRNAQKNATALVSRASKAADGTVGDPGLGSSSHPSISGDGRYVVFQSKSTNLSDEDLDGTTDVFVRDTATGLTFLVSKSTDAYGGLPGDGDSTEPVISADGRYVAFTSTATNLAKGDTNGKSDVFVRDLRRKETYLISVNQAGTASASGASSAPSIAPYGRAVAFQSSAHDITGDDGALTTDIFVRAPGARTTWLASRATGGDGAPAELSSYNPSISADGNTVAFESRSVTLTPLQNPPLISQVFVRQRTTGLTLLASRAEGQLGGAADRDATNASISPDGLYVGFTSAATGLSTEDDDGLLGLTPKADVFVRDLLAGSTTLVSRKAGGKPVYADSGNAVVGTAGSFALFTTAADLGPLPVGKGNNLYEAKLNLPLDLKTGAPVTVNYRRWDTPVTCSSPCTVYATGVIKLETGGGVQYRSSYIFGLKAVGTPNVETMVPVTAWDSRVGYWLKAGLDAGGTASITVTVNAAGLRGEKAREIVTAPISIPVPPTPTPTATPAPAAAD